MNTATAVKATPSDANDARRQPTPLQTAARAPRRLRLQSSGLFAGGNEIEIEHGEAIYRLRITSLGKLILTK